MTPIARCLLAVLAAFPQVSPGAEPSRVLELKGRTYHVQGIAVDGSRLWVTSVDSPSRKGYLHEFSLDDGRLVRSVEVQAGARFHPGGISADASSIWLPVAEYRRAGSSLIQRRSKRTLELESQFEVQDHIGCVAVKGGEVVGGNWDCRKFYVWTREGRMLREVSNPTDNDYQDLKFDGRRLVASGLLLPDRSGAIDWLDFPGLRLEKRIKLGKTDRGVTLTREGWRSAKGNCFCCPKTVPAGCSSSRSPYTWIEWPF